jgi:2,5-diketo-D-gluconate reductase A
MIDIPTLPLNDGRAIPQLGLGVWQIPDDETTAAVLAAVDVGYRSIDTAAIYRNEEGVGAAVRAAPVPRDDLFITTKVWNERQGFDETLRAFDESLRRLGLEQVDLYLIHWPAPRRDRYVDTWRALVRLREEGRARSIGVSNFTVAHLRRLFDETGVVPAVNQIELHPRFQQAELRAFHAEHGIATESWSPLAQGKLVGDPTIETIARKHGKTTAQVIIRWHLDLGLVVIPKSSRPERIRENADVFDFRLDEEDLARIDGLDRATGRLGFEPEEFA